jgi:hypothetical protein
VVGVEVVGIGVGDDDGEVDGIVVGLEVVGIGVGTVGVSVCTRCNTKRRRGRRMKGTNERMKMSSLPI